MKLGRGVLALCSKGDMGLITCDEPQEVTYADGTSGNAWVGIKVLGSDIGKPWSSRTPEVVAKAEGLFEALVNALTGGENTSKALDAIWSAIYPNTEWEYPGEVIRHTLAVLSEQRAEIKELKDALRPFAEAYAELKIDIPEPCDDSYFTAPGQTLRPMYVRDLRIASETLLKSDSRS